MQNILVIRLTAHHHKQWYWHMWNKPPPRDKKHPASGLEPKGTAQWTPSKSLSSTKALFALAKLWNVEQHHQKRANTAGSYYKGKPGPEDHAPQPLSTGNPGTIPYSKSHAQVAWPGEKKKKQQPETTWFVPHCVLTHRFIAKATSFSWSQMDKWQKLSTFTKHHLLLRQDRR